MSDERDSDNDLNWQQSLQKGGVHLYPGLGWLRTCTMCSVKCKTSQRGTGSDTLFSYSTVNRGDFD